MFKWMLGLALLLPGVGGCVVREGGRSHDDRGRGHEEHREHHGGAVVVVPAHVHGVGCGHVLRGGIWVVIH